ncbi:MAG: hypothetical protein UHW99_05130 [Methanobrevibacter sp.]|nr:hypothetical protein [Methanobrevibacter sp.]
MADWIESPSRTLICESARISSSILTSREISSTASRIFSPSAEIVLLSVAETEPAKTKINKNKSNLYFILIKKIIKKEG